MPLLEPEHLQISYQLSVLDMITLALPYKQKIARLITHIFNNGINFEDKICYNPELRSGIVAQSNGEIIGFGGITRRVITRHDTEYVIGGFGDMVIDPTFQARKIGLSVTQKVNQVLKEEAYDIGMGFCGPELLNFYGQSQWLKKDQGRVYKNQQGILEDVGITVLYVVNPQNDQSSFWFHDDIIIGPTSW